MSATLRVPPVPAVLRLVQMVVLGRWRATGEELYREVAELVGAAPGQEILVSGCGEGDTAHWLAGKTGAAVTGVDPDAAHIERAEMRARSSPVAVPPSYQQAPLDDLPHETSVFDGAIGEPALASAGDPERAVAELARVTRPLGTVVLLQLTWSQDLGADARDMLVERLGMRPHLLVEWKQMMRDAGLVEIQVQDWTAAGAATLRDGARRAEGARRPSRGNRRCRSRVAPGARGGGARREGRWSARRCCSASSVASARWDFSSSGG